MSAAEPTTRAATPRLIEGNRLDQAEFHRRYEAMPPGTRAELIGGVVYMPSPVGRRHGLAHGATFVWVSYYAENTPGLEALDNSTAILGPGSEPQPDVMLRLLPEYGGRTRTERGYVHGAPELVAEIAQATRYVDLGPKLLDYEQAGVLEYVVRAMDPDEILWFERTPDGFAPKAVSQDGIQRSSVFPGLWLDVQSLLDGDTRRLRTVVDQGIATADHAAFVAKLASAFKGPA